jgi:hypothetical protein
VFSAKAIKKHVIRNGFAVTLFGIVELDGEVDWPPQLEVH